MPDQHTHFEAASTLAVVLSSNEPLLLLSDAQKIIAASASFCRAFEIDPAAVTGRPLGEIGNGEWAMPKLASLLKATASGVAQVEAYEIDVTDIRAEAQLKDDLVREKAILLQEVQHRVANSLQIIASVLMQSARRVQSEEARGFLNDAHNRVMSIAALQRQLSVSNTGKVELRTYFKQLCQSLGASMIADTDRLSINVVVDESSVDANVSVSLGLIVTELVINALKHAFPEDRKGTILIDYRSSGADWVLLVADDGIGMPSGDDAPKAGLGTGIVEALVKNLGAGIVLSDAGPGTAVTISHSASVASEIEPALAV